jgi:hypothetical protein
VVSTLPWLPGRGVVGSGFLQPASRHASIAADRVAVMIFFMAEPPFLPLYHKNAKKKYKNYYK